MSKKNYSSDDVKHDVKSSLYKRTIILYGYLVNSHPTKSQIFMMLGWFQNSVLVTELVIAEFDMTHRVNSYFANFKVFIFLG